MAKATLDCSSDVTTTERRCSTCHGSGVRKREGIWGKCARCGGSGRANGHRGKAVRKAPTGDAFKKLAPPPVTLPPATIGTCLRLARTFIRYGEAASASLLENTVRRFQSLPPNERAFAHARLGVPPAASAEALTWWLRCLHLRRAKKPISPLGTPARRISLRRAA
jgi:hypothetical protein